MPAAAPPLLAIVHLERLLRSPFVDERGEELLVSWELVGSWEWASSSNST